MDSRPRDAMDPSRSGPARLARDPCPRLSPWFGMAFIAALLPACGGGGVSVSLEATMEADGSTLDVPERDTLSEVPTATDDGIETEVQPGEFGAPCTSNDNCVSGFCVEGASGFVCTKPCLEEDDCPSNFSCKGLVLGGDIYFLCVPQAMKACQPCTQDFQCPGGWCVRVDGQGRCAMLCGEDGTCKDPAYRCEEVVVPSSGEVERVCLPATGSCECLKDEQAGTVRTCAVSNDSGTCYGFETCDPAAGFTGCTAKTPAPEDCNGLDDDCDGLADDGLGEARECEVTVEGVGTCRGAARCQGPLGWVCDAPTPAPEVCDGRDNDCDGQTDEDFLVGGVYGTVDHCGTCGRSCVDTLANAVEACDVSKGVPRCVVAECDAGYFQANDTQCLGLSSIVCLPCNEDADCLTGHCVPFQDGNFCSTPCDGTAPAGFSCIEASGTGSFLVPEGGTCACHAARAGQTRPCMRSNEAGTCYGFETCDPALGFVGCTAQTPAPEECNGLDDDCDGVVDDGLTSGEPCSNDVPGVGSCPGTRVCQGPLGYVCVGAAPAPEACNYLDDDCDGLTDEDFRDAGGMYATDANCGVCGNDCAFAIAHGTGRCEVSEAGAMCVVASCEEGFSPVGGLACLPVPEVLCLPCADDTQCLGGTCVPLGSGTFCTRPCDADHPCPAGFSCGDGQTCAPDNGTCDCTVESKGAKRLCRVGNAFGVCYGVETCDPDAGGYVGCTAKTPAPEDCNGVDDDCNGLVDDGIPLVQPCENTVEGVGTCPGTATCQGTQGYVCRAAVPAPEACDYLDNDCDGLTDEDFMVEDPVTGSQVYGDAANCGVCGRDCDQVIVNGTGRCEVGQGTPRCVVGECDPGFFPLNDYQCVLAPVVTCQPCDQDAQCFGGLCGVLQGHGYCLTPCGPDGGACEPGFACRDLPDGRSACVPASGSCDCGPDNAGARRVCSQVNGYGTCFGFQTCDPATGWGPCSAAVPAAEVCDGLDNDCNGAADDGLPDTLPCENSNEHGTCAGAAFCYGKAGWVCQAPVPAPEVCDYQDNDCDGTVDDPFTTAGLYTDFHHCGTCGRDCGLGYPHAIMTCDATGAFPQCVVAACDPGYVQINEFQCVPAIAKLCEPCAVDDNCLAEGARCVPVGGEGTFCGLPCASQADCDNLAPGYECRDFGGFRQCIPATGSCSCDGTNPGLQKVCKKESGPTTCFGTMTCTEAGWSDCAMPPEACNLLDDDCDGQTDEGFLDASGHYSSDENCGKCGNNCTLLVFGNAHGVCNTSVVPFRCGPQCDEGFYDLDDNPNDCECHYLSATDFPGADDPAHPQALDVNCDGVDGEVDNAVFVAKWGDDQNPGTREAPRRTIQAGLDLAALMGKRDVYVATGVYQEAVVLARDVGVYGGYSSDFRVRDRVRYETAVLAPMPSDTVPGAVNCLGIQGGLPSRTVLDGFTVFAYPEKRPGRSSYGVYLQDCDGSVRISNNTLHGGSGGPGQRGADGLDGADGVPGSPGAPAFDIYMYIQQIYGVTVQHCGDLDGLGIPRPVSSGGAGGVSQCGSMTVSGGAGGNRVCPAWDQALDRPALPVASEYGSPGSGPGAAAGGAPGQDVFHQAYSCDGYSSFGPVEGGNGTDGAPGTDGQSGAGCPDPSGMVLGGLWFPATSGAGTSGGPGGGGGGGGSGAGAWVHTSCFAKGFGYDNFGGSGGGGGSGGCQGTGGTPGTGGGAAFTVFVTYSAQPASLPVLSDNLITTGHGGPGGNGGNGGVGGTGGLGALGGAGGGSYSPPSPTYPAFRGGKGGQGGRGGHGGGGGGGCGGPSFGLFVHGASGLDIETWKTSNALQVVGTGGPGGQGGFSLGQPGGDGADGLTAPTNF